MRTTIRDRAVYLAAALLLTIATGCGQLVSAQETGPETEAAQAAETVTGKIKEINGNEILLAIGSYGTGGGRAEAPTAEGGGPEPGSAPGGERSRPEGGGMPEGAGGGRGQNRGGQSTTDGFPGGMAGGGSASFTLSGEERTILIPVTAPVTTGQGENAREVRFTQLAVKNVISLDLDESGNILSVSVLE